jgi:hypothetical protein
MSVMDIQFHSKVFWYETTRTKLDEDLQLSESCECTSSAKRHLILLMTLQALR